MSGASVSISGPGQLDPAHGNNGPFVVVVSKVADEKALAFECRRKGFLVRALNKTKDGYALLLGLSAKLVIKLALVLDLPVKDFTEYTHLEKLMLASEAINVVNRAKAIEAKEVWVSHDKNMLSDIDNSKGESHLEHVKHYYGSKIAMYFGWLAFFTKVLAIPSIAGLSLFCHQLYLQTVDSAWVPFFCVLISLWSTYFLEFWKRRGNELSFVWRVFGVEDADEEDDLANAAKAAAGDGVAFRQMLSFITVLSLMLVMVRIMLYFKNMQLNASDLYGEDSWYKYYPTIIYSVLPAVATMIFEPIAEALNKFEGHVTKTDAENSLIMKHFALEFVNRYCALFHAAFWRRDLVYLRSLLVSLLTINAVLNNAIEIGMPMLKSYYNKWSTRSKLAKKDKKDEKAKQQGTNNGNTVETEPHKHHHGHHHRHAHGHGSQELRDLLEEEVSMPEYDLNADYLEIVIQYGYVTMFVVAFPLAPALALLNNIFEARVDLFKLTECRRPPLIQRSSIGAWQYCMEFISFLSVITNCYLMVHVSTHLELILPDELDPYVRSESGRMMAMMIMEHILLGFKVVMMYLIDDVPRWIREAIAQKHALERQKSVKERVTKFVKGEDASAESQSHSRTGAGLRMMSQVSSQVTSQVTNALGTIRKLTPSNSTAWFPQALPPHQRVHSGSSAPKPDSDEASISTLGQTEVTDDRTLHRKRGSSILSMFSLKNGGFSPRPGGSGRHIRTSSAGSSPLPFEAEVSPVTVTAPVSEGAPIAPAGPTGPASPNAAQRHRSRTNSGAMKIRTNSFTDEQNRTDFVDSAAATSSLPQDPSELMEDTQTQTTTESPIDRLAKVTASPFGFDPAHMMILICLPAALHYFQITPWLYIPLAVLFFGYLQTKKDRIDRKIAMGIVSDPTLLKLILEEMPSWPTDSEFQQMEWSNYMLQKFWPMLAIVGEEKACRIGQPILNRMKPAFLSELTIKRFSFGTIAPRFLGIRMHHTRDEERVVRCDLEMRYAGDPQIIIQVGPTEVEIVNLRISALLRCECLEFTPRMTPFKVTSCTMMKKPFVDFNIKVAGLEIMANKAMISLVHSLFHKVLQNVAMYPKKIFVPMGRPGERDDIDIEKLKALTPVGILYLTLERGVDLIQANVFGSSDPYVDIETIDQEMRSETIYSTTNPEWNETYDIVVYDRGSQVVSFTVSDFDVTNQNMCLGKAEFEVNKIPYNTRVQKTLQLKGVDKGSIIVSCLYVPIATARSQTESDKDKKKRRVPRSVFKGEVANLDDDEGGERDVLFDLPMEELHSDEVLISGDLALQMPEEDADGAAAAVNPGLGILMISKIRLRSLKAGAGSAWKPCVSIHVGTTKKQTRSKKNMVNPNFDEHFAFVIKDRAMTERILVKVHDKNRIMAASRQVGECAVSLFDLLNMRAPGPQGATIDKEYEVESEIVDCVVGFKMQWFSTQSSAR